jgi:hypothetical protein
MTRYVQCEALNLSTSQALYNLACYNDFVNCTVLTPLQFYCSVNLLIQAETISYAIRLVIAGIAIGAYILFALFLLGWTVQLLVFLLRITVFMIEDLWFGINIDDFAAGASPPCVS